VTAHDSAVEGVAGECQDGGLLNGRVLVYLTRPGTTDPAEVYLDRIGHQGSPSNAATWTGTWRIGSTRSGTWTISDVFWCHGGAPGEGRKVVPSPTASVTVVGSAAPTVSSWSRVPTVVPWGQRQWMVATYRDAAGHPLAGRPITVGDKESSCGWYSNGNRLQSTDDHGRLALRLLALYPYSMPRLCAYLANPQQVNLGTFATTTLLDEWYVGIPDRYEYYRNVSAGLSTAAIRSGRDVVVSGTAYPAVGTASLQRLVGRTWRTVSTARVRPSGRYTLTVQPILGPNYVRVLVRTASGLSLAPTTSRVLLLTGTTR